MSSIELEQRLADIEQMPQGSARRDSASEALLAEVPQDDVDLGFRLRLAMVSGYGQGTDPLRSLVPFGWCVAAYDAHPELAKHSHSFHWSLKWIPEWMVSTPAFSLDQTTRVLDDLERRYRDLGHSPHPVETLRCGIARHVGDRSVAAEHFSRWWAAPRGPLSDCEACDPSAKVDYLVWADDDEGAVAAALPVLDGSVNCIEQPHRIQAALLGPLTRTGRHEEAARTHRQGYAAVRSQAAELGLIAAHLEFCARTGNVPMALEIVRASRRLVDRAPSPVTSMKFHAAGSLALRLAAGQDPGLELDGESALRLSERWADVARGIAADFDRRNATSEQTRLVELTLEGEPWADFVPLSATARRVAGRTAEPAGPDATSESVEPGSSPVTAEPDALSEVPTDELLDLAEEARRTERVPYGLRAYEEFEQRTTDADRSPSDAARVLDGRALRLLVDGDGEGGLSLLREALVAHETAGDRGRTRLGRARIARALMSAGEIEEAWAVGVEPLRELALDPERPRSAWAPDLALLMLHHGEPDDDVLAVLETVGDDDPPIVRAQTQWLLAGIHDGQGRPDLALADLERIVEEQDAADLAWDVWARVGNARRRAGDLAGAVRALETAVAEGPHDDPQISHLVVDLMEAYVRSRQPDLAILLGAELLHGSRPVADQTRPYLLDTLSDASGDAGDHERALEHADALSELVEAGTPAAGRAAELRGWALAGLGRRAEGGDALHAAAELEGDLEERVRLTVVAAFTTDEPSVAEGWRREAEELLASVDEQRPVHVFRLAQIAQQRAEQHARDGDTSGAVEQSGRAIELYDVVEMSEAAADQWRLRLGVEPGPWVDGAREHWQSMEPGSRSWYQLGYAVSDVLSDVGRRQESTSVLEVLEDLDD